MDRKIGIYIVSGGVVSFASTATSGGGTGGASEPEEAALSKEVSRVHSYWTSHGTGKPIDELILVGRNAGAFEAACRKVESSTPFSVHIAEVWSNAFDVNRHLPPISRADSLEFSVAAGLALDTSYEE